jgi:outer membrane biosynthesis protein TonB
VVQAQPSSQQGGGGNAKYIALGLLLLAGAYGFWVFLQPPEPAPAPPAPPPPEPEAPERENPLAEPEFDLEVEPEPEPEKPKKTGKTRVRYVRGAWECSGDIDRKAAARLVATNKRQVTTCYERRLKMNNVLQGNLKLRVKVGATGDVVATAVSGTLNDREVYNCVRNLAKKWSFPPPEGGNCAIVEAPFNFTPRKD